MSGICGWIDSGTAAVRDGSILTDMLTRLNGDDLAPGEPILTSAGAIAARSGIVPVFLQRAGTLVVAVQGRVDWHLPDLSMLAAERGCAAALAEAYRRNGNECLKHIGGPCAIAIVDTDGASGLLAVDRMGIRTLCFANPSGHLVFGSTADSVAAHPKVGREMSQQGIFNYLYHHVVPSPGTIYRSVLKLRPGECLTFRDGAVERRFYWQLRYYDEEHKTFDTLAERFRPLLRDSAKRCINEDAEVGAFLSGGTDSSTITGLLSELRGKPAKTYSIGFAADGFDEMEYARITAKHFSADPLEYYVTPQDVVEAIPLIAQAYDEPFGNSSAVPTYFCARMARADGVKVLLAGDGGDEIFGGNVRYARQKIFEWYWSVPGPLRRTLIEPLTLGLPAGDQIPVLRKLRSYIHQASVPLPDRLESYNFLHRSPLEDVFEPEFLAKVDTTQPLALLREVYQRTASTSPVNRMMHLDLKFTLADNDLRKVSRMCELAGLEVRYPLLDDALVEFSGEIPASLKVKGLRLRYFFKQALKDFLPPETIAKIKHGFGMPFGLWLKTHKPLRNVAFESLHAFQQRGVVKPGFIKELWNQHDTNHATYFGEMIWVIMMLEFWMAKRRLWTP